jgi:hypothetical protein
MTIAHAFSVPRDLELNSPTEAFALVCHHFIFSFLIHAASQGLGYIYPHEHEFQPGRQVVRRAYAVRKQICECGFGSLTELESALAMSAFARYVRVSCLRGVTICQALKNRTLSRKNYPHGTAQTSG